MHYKRRVAQAASGFVIGGGMVAAGAVLPLIWLAVGGSILMLLCSIWAMNSWRRMAGVALGVAGRAQASQRPARRKNRGKAKNRGAMMERLDERWRRRQEGDL